MGDADLWRKAARLYPERERERQQDEEKAIAEAAAAFKSFLRSPDGGAAMELPGALKKSGFRLGREEGARREEVVDAVVS